MNKYFFNFKIMTIVVAVSLLAFGEIDAQEKPVEEENVEEKKQDKKIKKTLMFKLDPLVVNLARSQGSQFLKITISLEANSPEVIPGIEKNIAPKTSILLETRGDENVKIYNGN